MEAEFGRLQRYADRSFLVQAKQDTDSYLDKIIFQRLQGERSCEEGLVAVRCSFICSRGRSVLKSWKNVFCPRGLVSPLDMALDSRTGWDLNDLAQRAKNVVTFTTRKTNFDCCKMEWTWYHDDTHEVA